MPRFNADPRPVEVELVGGPLHGRRITVPRDQYRWLEAGHCYVGKADGCMHYVQDYDGVLTPPERPIKASDLLVAQMATANHALPADHPLKITRQDVADLQRACDIMEQIEDGSVWRRYVRLRDKLAALLPPEGQPNE